MRPRLLGAILVCTIALAAYPASAQEASYDSLVREGLSEFHASRWVEAYTLFLQAHELSPNARTLRGMGMTSYELGEYARALDELQAALDSSERMLAPDQQAQVRELMARAARLVGTLELTVTPVHAAVLINDEMTKKREVRVPVGKVVVRAELEGHRSARRVVTVTGGKRYPINLALHPLDGTAPLPPVSGAPAASGAPGHPESNPDLGLSSNDAAGQSDRGSIVDGPWLWIGVGVAVAGGVIAAILLSGSDDPSAGEPLPAGNAGVDFSALRRAGR